MPTDEEQKLANATAMKTIAEQGFENFDFFKHPLTGERMSYSEMRSWYG